MQAYLADIYSLDEDIGRLLKRLDELGLSNNTIVVFSSDQGAAPIRTEGRKEGVKQDNSEHLRLNAMGYNGIHRGGKHGMYEGGVRVPWIVRWPGHVPANRVDEKSVISGADFLPTLCALTGVKIDIRDFDGEDASAAWLGTADHVRTKPLFGKPARRAAMPAFAKVSGSSSFPHEKKERNRRFTISSTIQVSSITLPRRIPTSSASFLPRSKRGFQPYPRATSRPKTTTSEIWGQV